ncbi:MAG: molybdate ABC transporter substrate-binding protein [Rhodomicrobium sp.]
MPLKSRAAAAFVVILSASILSVSMCAAAGSGVINVYTATSFAVVLRAAINRYQQGSTLPVAVKEGQSADFAKKIEQRAPANIFISASGQIVDTLIAKGVVDREAVASPVGNDLVLVAPINSALKEVLISPEFDFTGLLGPNEKLALGDPDYTPIGIYAMAALSKLGQWKSIAPRLARASSAKAALELVESGQAPLGITFSTEATASNKVKVLGRFPKSNGIAIRYTFAIVKDNDGLETRKLFAFLIGPEALQIYAKFGFTVGDQVGP